MWLTCVFPIINFKITYLFLLGNFVNTEDFLLIPFDVLVEFLG